MNCVLKRIALIENKGRAFALATGQVVRNLAKRHDIKVSAFSTNGQPVGGPADIAGADLIIACGGDGTIIEAAHRSKGSGIPIAGINAGYLGFLSAFSGKDDASLQRGLACVFDGSFIIERRAAIEAMGMWAINDIVLAAQDKGTLLNLHLNIGGAAVTKYFGDGLIVATPTGSTAYSLAAGGPVVAQGNRSLIITPICPHSFANRSIVVSEDDEIEVICPDSNRSSPMLSCDGKTRDIKNGAHLQIRVSKTDFPLVSLKETNRYEILVEKLGWRSLPQEG